VPKYRIELHRQAEKGLAKLPRALQEKAVAFIERALAQTPLERIPGKTKKLQGRFAGIYQYDLSRSARIWWRVDEAKKTVYIIYIGLHPKETE
jgi:mRNA-degrading endonuclease RelE of RelBE toxin-antitoxin system